MLIQYSRLEDIRISEKCTFAIMLVIHTYIWYGAISNLFILYMCITLEVYRFGFSDNRYTVCIHIKLSYGMLTSDG